MRRCVIVALALLSGWWGCVPALGGEPAGTPGTALAASEEARDPTALLRRSQDLEGNDPRAAWQIAQQALTVARQRRDPSKILASLAQASRAGRGVAAYAEASALASEGLDLATATGDPSAAGELLVARGMVQWNLADLPAATESFLQARSLAEKLDRDDLRIGAEAGLGLVYSRGEKYEESRAHLWTALQLAEKTHDPRLPAILNYVGNACLVAKDYASARGYFEQVLALSGDGKNQRLVAYVLLNLGEIANRTGDQALAARHLDDAMAICRRYDLPRGIADAHYLYARVERSLGRPDSAARHLDEGMVITTKLGNPDLFVSFYEEYTLTLEAQGDFRGALEYSRKLAVKTDEILGERNRRQVAELQARYESETRNQQIKLLKRDAELRQTALDLKNSDLSRTRARFYAFAEIVVFTAIIAAVFIAWQRSRVRRTARMLVDIRAAKEIIEASAAQKGRLLDIATLDLSASEARFRDAFTHSPLGLALVSPEGAWMRVNEALCQIVGYTEAEMLATTFQAITHPDDLAGDLELLEKLRRGDIETYHLNKRYFHRAGHIVWIRLDVSMHRDPATNQPRYFISQIQDISECRRAQELLRQAKEEAEAANHAKSEFLSRMSHELRTPLNAILGFGQLLELQDLGSAHNQSVQYVLTAGRHLLSLINEVLDLSSIESGKFALCLESTPVSDLMSTTLELMRPLAEEAGIGLAVEYCPGAGNILADPRRLKQVLLNLIANAIKYNRAGGKVTVRCGARDQKLWIAVEDTGPGIAAADIERVFAPFGRLPATQEVPGTGLGLSLSRALTEAMGGTLTVAGQPGVGSTFTVTFAKASHHELEPALVPMLADIFAVEQAFAGEVRHKVLYIEDDRTNLELVERLLALDPSLHVFSAISGARGVEVARQERPDVILLDVHLTDMDGAEVLKTLRADPVTADVPVVVVSADAMRSQIERMRDLGACEYVTKPIDIKELRRAIKTTLHAGAATLNVRS